MSPLETCHVATAVQRQNLWHRVSSRFPKAKTVEAVLIEAGTGQLVRILPDVPVESLKA